MITRSAAQDALCAGERPEGAQRVRHLHQLFEIAEFLLRQLLEVERQLARELIVDSVPLNERAQSLPRDPQKPERH